MLDPDGFVERCEIRSVDLLHNRQELGVAIEPQASIHQLQDTHDLQHDFLRSIDRRFEFRHLALVSPRAPIGIAQGFGEAKARLLKFGTNRNSPCGVSRSSARCRCVCQQAFEFHDQFVEFFAAYNPFEDVEARAPVGLGNVLSQNAIGIKLNGATVAQLVSTPFSHFQIIICHSCSSI